ncbi:hypothetical protein [Deinococcus proteolyticus]|nr:hypothetical protein [Deinococcus proteolyticus]
MSKLQLMEAALERTRSLPSMGKEWVDSDIQLLQQSARGVSFDLTQRTRADDTGAYYERRLFIDQGVLMGDLNGCLIDENFRLQYDDWTTD